MSSEFGDVELYYRKFYDQMPCGCEQGGVARLAHSKIERPFGPRVHFAKVLEVGAGSGLHFPFVRHSLDHYEMSDVDETSLDVVRRRFGERSGVSVSIADAQALPHRDASQDRIVATCVLLHLHEPEAALREWRRVTRPGGVVSIYVPNEPSLLTRTGRAVTSRRAAKKAGYQGFDLMIARDHINHGWGLDQMIRYVFRDDRLRVVSWPIPRSPISTRVFTVYHAYIGGRVSRPA